MNILKKAFYIILATTFFTIILTTAQIYIDSDINNFVVEEAIAQSSCTNTCLTGLDPTSGPDGRHRLICEGMCDCKFVWVKYGDFGTGSCKGLSSDPEEN